MHDKRGRPRTGNLFKRDRYGNYISASSSKKGTWWLRYKIEGKTYCICLGTQDKAEAERERALHMGVVGPSANRTEYLQNIIRLGKLAEIELGDKHVVKRLPLDSVWDLYLHSKRRPASGAGTLAAYRSQWNKLLKWIVKTDGGECLDQINQVTAENFVTYLDDSGYKAVSKALNFYKLLWNAVSPDTECPFNGLQTTKKYARAPYRRLSCSECSAIYTGTSGEMQAVTTLAYYTALRAKDCCMLKQDAIDWTSGTLRIIPEKTATSKGAALVIPLLPQLLQVLEAFKGIDKVYMFPVVAGGYMNDQSRFSKQIRKLFKSLDIADNSAGKASFHSYRATFISLMDEADVNPHITDRITGHAAQSMHDRYTQIDIEAARDAMMRAIKRLVEHDNVA